MLALDGEEPAVRVKAAALQVRQLGRVLGAIAGKRAEILGGVLLIGIGTAIVFEHLSAAS